MAVNTAIGTGHAWVIRELRLNDDPLIQHTCPRCGRNFVDEVRTGARYAVHVGAMRFDRLSDEVTARWLVNSCPGERLESDQADLETHFFSHGIESGSSQHRRAHRATSAVKRAS